MKKTYGFLIIILLLIGYNVTASEITEKRNMTTIRTLLNGFNTGNTEQLNQLVHKDFINHYAADGMRDRAGFHKIVKMVHSIFASFDSLELKPVLLFAKGNFVAMMDVGTGKKNGKTYTHTDIHIFKMKDGKMIEHWNSFGLPMQKQKLMDFMKAAK